MARSTLARALSQGKENGGSGPLEQAHVTLQRGREMRQKGGFGGIGNARFAGGDDRYVLACGQAPVPSTVSEKILAGYSLEGEFFAKRLIQSAGQQIPHRLHMPALAV